MSRNVVEYAAGSIIMTMATQISERIRLAVYGLKKEEDALVRALKDVKSSDSKTKSSMHNLEMRIISEALIEKSPSQTSRMLFQVKELHHDKQILNKDIALNKVLNQKLHDLQKKITTYEFWMKHADTDDEAKQNEAQHKIFG